MRDIKIIDCFRKDGIAQRARIHVVDPTTLGMSHDCDNVMGHGDEHAQSSQQVGSFSHCRRKVVAIIKSAVMGMRNG